MWKVLCSAKIAQLKFMKLYTLKKKMILFKLTLVSKTLAI